MSEPVEPLTLNEIAISDVMPQLDTAQFMRILETALLTSAEPLALSELKKLSDTPLENNKLEALLEEL